MTTISFTNSANHTFFAADYSPRQSFAARLAALQARQEHAPHLTAVFGVAARVALAAVPVGAMAWLFVFV